MLEYATSNKSSPSTNRQSTHGGALCQVRWRGKEDTKHPKPPTRGIPSRPPPLPRRLKCLPRGFLFFMSHPFSRASCRENRPVRRAMARLWAIRTDGDGDCLLHSVSLSLWGLHDRTLVSRCMKARKQNDLIASVFVLFAFDSSGGV